MVDGFSSADPRLARGPQVAAKPRRRRSSGSRRRTPSVSVIGGTVKIDGVGYSVAPSLQEKFIRERTGGRGSSAQTAMKAAAAAVVKAADMKRIEEAKSFAEKMKIATEMALSKQAQAEFQRILNFRSNLIRKGATEDKRMSTDVKTGEKLEVSQWRDKQGNRVQRIKNIDKGTTTYSSFKKPKRGHVRRVGGVTMGSVGTVISGVVAGVKIVKSSDPKRLIVTFPNGRTGTIKSTGRVVVGARLAGKKYVFMDGKIISVDGRDTTGRVEYEKPQPKTQVAPASLFKRIAGAFSVKKFRAYREKQRQDYYDLYGLTGDDRNFYKLADAARTTKLTPTNQNKFNKMTTDHLKQDLQNPDTAIRAEVALIIAAVAGGPLIGGAIGAAYKSPIALAKDLGVEEDLKNVTWQDVAKKGGVEFGKNALISYTALKLFGLGAKAALKVPSLARVSLGAVGLKKAGMFTGKSLKFALKKGLNIVGAEYLSSVGVDVAKLGKKIKQKKYKAATVKASELLGVLVGFYGERAVRSALRKVMLAEDPRLILTKGTKKHPIAIENRHITLARLNKVKKNLKGKRRIKFAKASPVREPRKKKIVTPEKRRLKEKGIKIDVPTPSGYATYAVGKDVYIIPKTFLRIRPNNTPKTYYTKWFQNIKKKGLLPTLKELGLPRTYKPTIYKGSGEYLPRHKGESLKAYYARGQRVANKSKVVQVLAAPKTVLGSTQPELEIKTIYPNPKGIKASVTRVKVGEDGFGHAVIVEIVAPKSFIERLKFKIKAKIEFKREALKYLTNREAKIAKDLTPRIIQNYDFIYKSKKRGSEKIRKHMLKVEQNFRRILRQYKIKASDAEIKAVSRLHDILKLRGLNVKDEPIIRKAILEGYLNEIPLIKKLTFRQKKRVADAIGFHQDVNPKTLKALRLNKFTKAFINADRLDITRYGIKVNPKKLFNVRARRLIPKNVRKEFVRLNRLRIKRMGFTVILRKRYNSLVKKYPGLKGKRFEDKIISENKARYKRLSPKEKARLRKQEKGYKDYKESLSEYKRLKKGKYQTRKYKTYKSPRLRSAYRNGYNSGEKAGRGKPRNYRTSYGRYQSAYASGYKTSYKGNYRINYKTGKYSYKSSDKKRPIIPKIEKKFTKKKLSKSQPVFYIKVKKKGRIVNLLPRPLTSRDAKDYLTFKLDRGIIRTGYLEPIGRAKNVVRAPKNIRGYFSKNKRKVRPYRIRVGKKKMLRNGLIEKRKYIQDTLSEKRALQLARKRAALKKRKPTKRKVVKRKPIKRVRAKRKLSTLSQLKNKKKSLVSKRKRMINKLKKK